MEISSLKTHHSFKKQTAEGQFSSDKALPTREYKALLNRLVCIMLKFYLLLFTLSLPVSAGQQDNRKVTGTTQDIEWGKNWAGPELKAPADIKGKVTLLVIWGR